MRKLYDAFTDGGAIASRWEACGVKTHFDEETQNLEFTLPPGWTDTMSDEDRSSRGREWCIDDPSYGVEYVLELQKAIVEPSWDVVGADLQPTPFQREKMHFTEKEGDEDGKIEMYTGINFQTIDDVTPGTVISLRVMASVKMATGEIKVLKLLEGRFEVPENPVDLGNGTPGIFFVLEAGFVLFAHLAMVGEHATNPSFTHFALAGKMHNLESA
jgi:hypothetical protein